MVCKTIPNCQFGVSSCHLFVQAVAGLRSAWQGAPLYPKQRGAPFCLQTRGRKAELVADLEDKLRRIAMAMKDSFIDVMDESQEASAKDVYFSEGLYGVSCELLKDLSAAVGEDDDRDSATLEILAFLRSIYSCCTGLFLTVKSLLACLLYSVFRQGNIQHGVDALKGCGALIEIAARGDDEIRELIMAQFRDVQKIACSILGCADKVVQTLEHIIVGDRLQDNSIRAQIQRLCRSEVANSHQLVSDVHSLLWKNFKEDVERGEVTPRMTIYIPAVMKRLAVRDFLKKFINEAAGTLVPMTGDELLAINDVGGNVPVLIYGRVNHDTNSRFVRAIAVSYDQQDNDRLYYKASAHSCTNGFPDASKKTVYPYYGPSFRLLRRGLVEVHPVLQDSKPMCSTLERPVIVVGLTKDDARDVMGLLGMSDLTVVYVSGQGGMSFIQNEEVATKKALLFVPTVKVLSQILEPRRDPTWQKIADRLGYSWDTSFDCLLVDQVDKHTSVIDENSRLVISVDSIESLCDVKRIAEIRELIRNNDAREFAWTPPLCKELGVDLDKANEIVRIPYVCDLRIEKVVNEMYLKARESSGGMWAGRLRRVAFSMHAPLIATSANLQSTLRQFVEDHGINFVEFDSVNDSLLEIESGLGVSPLHGSNCMATGKYSVIKERAEGIGPNSHVMLYHPVAVETTEEFITRMSHLCCENNTFVAEKNTAGANEVWYTFVRPGRREVLDFLYPKAKKSIWFLYPLEEQMLQHVRKICNRFLMGLFPIETLCTMLGVKYEAQNSPTEGNSEQSSVENTRKNRLDSLMRYFNKMKVYGFDDDEAATEIVDQVDVAWKISLDNGAMVWATNEYESLVESENGDRKFVKPKDLKLGMIVWELQPPREMVLLSPDGIQRLVEKQGCPLYYRWKELLEEYRKKHGLSKRELHGRLRAIGVNVTYEAVLFWLADNGLMCPKNGARTLSLIADMIGCPELKAQAPGIEHVARTIRVFNQCEARDVYDTIRRAFRRGESECEIGDATIDLNQYGLFSSGKLAKVERVEGIKKPGYLVNRILKESVT